MFGLVVVVEHVRPPRVVVVAHPTRTSKQRGGALYWWVSHEVVWGLAAQLDPVPVGGRVVVEPGVPGLFHRVLQLPPSRPLGPSGRPTDDFRRSLRPDFCSDGTQTSAEVISWPARWAQW